MQVIFAGWNVLAKDLMSGGVNPITFMAYRLICASAVLLLYAYIAMKRGEGASGATLFSIQKQHVVRSTPSLCEYFFLKQRPAQVNLK